LITFLTVSLDPHLVPQIAHWHLQLRPLLLAEWLIDSVFIVGENRSQEASNNLRGPAFSGSWFIIQ